MNKLMDFYDAFREVAGTERMVKYMDCNWAVFKKTRNGLPYLQTSLRDNSIHHWWPSPAQAKKKAWEVELSESKTIVGKFEMRLSNSTLAIKKVGEKTSFVIDMSHGRDRLDIELELDYMFSSYQKSGETERGSKRE